MFRFHHIGIAVKSIELTADLYIKGGYKLSSTIFDPIQNINIAWLTKKGMPLLELLEPVDESSPTNKILQKNGVTPYHICYAVSDIDETTKMLLGLYFIVVSKPSVATALKGARVVFFYNKNIGLIELVEEPAEIIE